MKIKVIMKKAPKKAPCKRQSVKKAAPKRKPAKKKAASKVESVKPNTTNIRDPEWREVCTSLPVPAVEQKTVPGVGVGPYCEVLVKHPHVNREFRKLAGGINPATGKDAIDPVVYSVPMQFSKVWVRVWIGNETNGRGHVLRQQLPPGVNVGEVVRWAGGSKQAPAKLVETLIKAN